ncbi:MAG: YciE/YciF ferroxidase family protein [Ktedonobacterales bacterium]
MAMQTAQDLFMFELGDMYDAEQRIVLMLPQLANETDNPQVQQALQQHLKETQQQIQNIEQCFQIFGQRPVRESCMAIQGLKQEHDAFLKENPAPQLLTMFDLGGAFKTEHYEIASYTGLIDKCKLMGQNDCAQLLQQNLQQEQAMAQRVSTLSQQLGQQLGQQLMGQVGQSPPQPLDTQPSMGL